MKMSLPVALILPLLAGAILLGGCATTPEVSPADKKAAPVVKATVAAPSVAPKPVVAPLSVLPPTDAAITFTPPALPLAPVVKLAPAAPLPDPAKKAEVVATVEHLTQDGKDDTMAHELSDTTGFPQAIASLAPGAQTPKTEVIYIGTQPPAKGLTADGNSTDLVEKDWTGLVLVPLGTSLSKAHTSAVRLVKVEAHPLSDGRVRVWIRVKNNGDRALPTEIACIFRMDGEKSGESPFFYELEVPGHVFRDVFFVSPAGRLNTYTVLVRPKFNYSN